MLVKVLTTTTLPNNWIEVVEVVIVAIYQEFQFIIKSIHILYLLKFINTFYVNSKCEDLSKVLIPLHKFDFLNILLSKEWIF